MAKNLKAHTARRVDSKSAERRADPKRRRADRRQSSERGVDARRAPPATPGPIPHRTPDAPRPHLSDSAPGVDRYFDALRDVLRIEAEVLTRVVPHAAERGRANEDRFRRFLARVLPRKFSLGTGFIVSSAPDLPASPQMDIVLYDAVSNAPLGGDGAAQVFPVEMVYGAVEVRSAFSVGDFPEYLDQVAKIRELARTKAYALYHPREKRDGKAIGVVRELPGALSPRCYFVAYDGGGPKLVRGGDKVFHWSGGDLRLRRSKIQPVVRRSFVLWTKGRRRDVCRGGLRSGSAICFQ